MRTGCLLRESGDIALISVPSVFVVYVQVQTARYIVQVHYEQISPRQIGVERAFHVEWCCREKA